VQGGVTIGLYSTIQAALTGASDGDIIETQAVTFGESPNLGVQITLRGGFNAPFTSQTGYSTIAGTLTIGAGAVIVENLIIE
jgi:hypothetical protein